VVVVDWNSTGLVTRCLSALAGQTVPPHRVVVIDNASRNATWKQVRLAPSRLDMVRLSSNVGFASACNLGIALSADCDFIALVNPDAFVDPDWLEVMQQAADAHPECASFACRLLSAEDPRILDGTGDVCAVTGLAWRRDHGAPAHGLRMSIEEVFGPSAAAALYRRGPLLEVGGFDDSFFCYFEDVDLAFRLRIAGHRCLYVPAAVARHVGSATTVRHSDFSVYHAHRNLVWSFLKNMPAPLLALYAPLHLALNLLSIVHFSARGQGGTILRAKRDALLGLSRVLAERRTVQSARRISARALRRLLVAGPRAFGIGRFEP
jgi:GT2 family glycosyltransferase